MSKNKLDFSELKTLDGGMQGLDIALKTFGMLNSIGQSKEAAVNMYQVDPATNTSPYFNLGGNLEVPNFKQYNGGAHGSGADVPVDANGQVNPGNPVGKVQNKENSYKSYVFSDELVNPLTGNKFNMDAKKLVKKYAGAAEYKDEKEALEMEMSKLMKTNDGMKALSQPTPEFAQGGNLDGEPPKTNPNYFSKVQSDPNSSYLAKLGAGAVNFGPWFAKSLYNTATRSDLEYPYNAVSQYINNRKYAGAEENPEFEKVISKMSPEELKKLPNLNKGGKLPKYTNGGFLNNYAEQPLTPFKLDGGDYVTDPIRLPNALESEATKPVDISDNIPKLNSPAVATQKADKPEDYLTSARLGKGIESVGKGLMAALGYDTVKPNFNTYGKEAISDMSGRRIDTSALFNDIRAQSNAAQYKAANSSPSAAANNALQQNIHASTMKAISDASLKAQEITNRYKGETAATKMAVGAQDAQAKNISEDLTARNKGAYGNFLQGALGDIGRKGAFETNVKVNELKNSEGFKILQDYVPDAKLTTLNMEDYIKAISSGNPESLVTFAESNGWTLERSVAEKMIEKEQNKSK